jgi:prolipoprotein diacylglyceryltransferase
LIDFVQLRAEYASLGLVALALFLSAGTVATLVGMSRDRVTDLYFGGTIAFLVAGRLWWLIAESPGSLVDPLVLVQVQTGMEPLAGVVGVLGVLGWRVQSHREDLWPGLAVGAAGFALATITYDAACPLRDACYGAPAPSPWGFRMSGLADTRLATPLIEAAVVMLVLAGVIASWRRLGVKAAALSIMAALALTRAALTPLSVLEWDAVGLETLALAVAGLAGSAAVGAGVARRWVLPPTG